MLIKFILKNQKIQKGGCITKMSVFPVFVFLVIFFPVLGVGIDDCTPIRCWKDGPKIQFPFRHKYLQPQHCGYHPGFDLYCNHKNNETVLELPFSVKVMVNQIDYVSQTVQIYVSEGCLPQKLLYYTNLSASPFQYSKLHYNFYDHILFNCSANSARPKYLDFLVPCLGDSSNQVYAIPIYTYAIDHSSSLISCTKLSQISSIPSDIFYEEYIDLKWSEPACGHCETEGKLCRLNNYTRGHQVMCMDKSGTKKGQSNTQLIAGVSLGSVLFIVIAAALYLLYSSIRADKENQVNIEKFLEDYRALKPTRFSYADVKKITNEFSEKLGEGGYGIVYKGKLPGEISVAVKVLNHSQGKGEEFINEVGTIGKIHHVNVVRLVGFCADRFKRALVYEFLPNDSLEKYIFQKGPRKNSFSWEKLQEIALGIAKGIEYLHQGCDQQILHFDIKPHNILLDHNFNPKICDFGLAKLCSKEQSAVSMTVARGTIGYIAPEVLSRTFGKASSKSDVYSYGMLLLEVVGGRKNIDHSINTSQVYFPQWIYNHLNQGKEISLQIEEGDEHKIVRKLTIVGLLCIQWYPADRPSMKSVVQMLEGVGDDLTMPPNPFPDTNATDTIAGMPGRHYQTGLELISELE